MRIEFFHLLLFRYPAVVDVLVANAQIRDFLDEAVLCADSHTPTGLQIVRVDRDSDGPPVDAPHAAPVR